MKNNPQPLFDSATHYRIEVQGQVDVIWLQSFEGSAEIHVEESGEAQDITLLNVITDQSGMVGLLRRLHGIGVIILQLQIASAESKAAEDEEQH